MEVMARIQWEFRIPSTTQAVEDVGTKDQHV